MASHVSSQLAVGDAGGGPRLDDAEGDARGAPRLRLDPINSGNMGKGKGNAEEPIELLSSDDDDDKSEPEERHHPGELEPAEDGFVDWDDECHGDRYSNAIKREYPDEYVWDCCNQRGSSVGCTEGEGWTLEEKYTSSPVPDLRTGETRHPGDLEVNYDSTTWNDWDESCHGTIDTKSNKSEFPEGFVWSCCGKEGTYASGCEGNSDDNDDHTDTTPPPQHKSGYTLQFDGGSRGNPGPAGSGYVLYDPDGKEIIAGYNFLGTRTNNYAEYTGLIEGLKKAKELGIKGVCEGDSKLVVSQMNGVWKVKHPDMAVLKNLADEVRGEWEFKWIPRAENARADKVANIAMDREEDGVETSDV
ncbi:hypothetical protein TL16_g03903 [Triparma laevis f. inornata]|uniref:RNase H type-1 domain-containing protein n=1 Tax=Triparma laevis f. inornata TaxID=1714386 RepID=A0A9W7A7Q3_9STRA|nr:hypothetical protein TL16_g03903 [Triparma laevis f. inornata]